MTVKTEAARRCGNIDTRQNVHVREDKQIITDYERGARYAAYAICGMFALMIVWMWFAW